jgi:hypothetical protein
MTPPSTTPPPETRELTSEEWADLRREAENPTCVACGHWEVWHRDGRYAQDRLEEGFEGEWWPGPCKGEYENRRCRCPGFLRAREDMIVQNDD